MMWLLVGRLFTPTEASLNNSRADQNYSQHSLKTENQHATFTPVATRFPLQKINVSRRTASHYLCFCVLPTQWSTEAYRVVWLRDLKTRTKAGLTFHCPSERIHRAACCYRSCHNVMQLVCSSYFVAIFTLGC